MRTLMIALGLIAAFANPIFAEEDENLPHEIWACDGLRSEWNRVNEPFILEGNMREYRFKYRGSETILKLLDENRVPGGFRIYAGYFDPDWGNAPHRIEGAYYIWCNSGTCDEASEMKFKMLMWDQPNREGKCLKMN